MPHPRWKHYCFERKSTVWLGKDQCDDCCVLGEYDGWHFNMWESMAAYGRRTDLKPIGGHRALADLLLGHHVGVLGPAFLRAIFAKIDLSAVDARVGPIGAALTLLT